MKKQILVWIGIVSCAMLVSCGKANAKNEENMNETQKADETKETDGTKEPDTQLEADDRSSTDVEIGGTESENSDAKDNIAAQIQLIADNVDIWRVFDETDGWGYAITDMDQNGRLEIVASECHGTGFFSFNNVWEVNENFDGLLQCEQAKEEGESEADIMVGTVPVYHDLEQNRYYFIFQDSMKNGAAEYYENQRAWFLENGIITETVLAFKEMIYADETHVDVTCTDAEDNVISEAEYDGIADSYFSALQKQQADIHWLTSIHTADMEKEELCEMLEESYHAFTIR